MHSDHTIDYPELAFTLWWRRTEPLQVRGPVGVTEMTEGMYAMMAPDTRLRGSGTQPVGERAAWQVDVAEIEEGVVLEKDDIRIEAFSVNHGDIKPAFGYRITTEDKVIVISGDTAYSEKLKEMAAGADILFHEVISDSGLSRTSESFQAYHKSSHTTASDLGRLASEAQPGLLVLYHGLFYGVPESRIIDEIRSTWDGPVILANDLDIF
jgi:ribonuclease BN (tRNA processing enzyme)